MAKVGRPSNLIAYDTIAGAEAAAKGGTARPKLFRTRTMLYAGLITLVAGLVTYALASRTLLEINVLPDRNPFFVRLSNGDIRNGYTVKILNKLHEPRTFNVTLEGIEGAKLTVVGHESEAVPTVRVATDALEELRIFVSLPGSAAAAITSGVQAFSFNVTDTESGRVAKRYTNFRSQ
jgi:polyferredoxin